MSLASTVYIIDDDDAMRDSLQWLIESVHLDVQTYASARDFLGNFDTQITGCLVLDVRMPEMSGLELQEKLTDDDVRIPVIVITGHGDVPMAVRALKAGAYDFIEKPFNDQVLLERIQQAVNHDLLAHRKQAQRDSVLSCLASLTPRERQVLDLLINGKSTKAIAAQLQLSTRTAEIHRGHVMEKMQATSLCELMHKAIIAELVGCTPQYLQAGTEPPTSSSMHPA